MSLRFRPRLPHLLLSIRIDRVPRCYAAHRRDDPSAIGNLDASRDWCSPRPWAVLLPFSEHSPVDSQETQDHAESLNMLQGGPAKRGQSIHTDSKRTTICDMAVSEGRLRGSIFKDGKRLDSFLYAHVRDAA